jgi:hypothetical protein
VFGGEEGKEGERESKKGAYQFILGRIGSFVASCCRVNHQIAVEPCGTR